MSVETTRLESGIRVVTDRMPSVETVSVGAWFDVGARYETEAQNGISHLLEHMAFKGTETRSARRIAEEIEAVGGHLNAYTSRDHTTYYARVLKDDLALAVDLLADILQNARFDATELAREKDVILQEIGQAHDTPDDLVFDLLQEAAYPAQALGRTILGPAARVSAFCADDIRAYMASHYVPERLVVAAAGNLDHAAVVAEVAACFAAIRGTPDGPFEPARYGGGTSLRERGLEQLHLALALPAFAYDDADFYALQVFNTIYGGGMSSRLFQEVREERGLAYSVYSYAVCHADTGVLGVYAGTGAEHAADLVPVIAGELKSLATQVSGEELARAKAQLKAGLLMSLESTGSRAEQLGRQTLMFGRTIPNAELIASVEAVDEAAIRRVAARLLGGKPTLAAVGPHAGLPDTAGLDGLFSG